MALEDYGSRLAVDARSLDDLRLKARQDPREALRGATQQFEAYFMQSMLKSMRETLNQDTPFDSEQTRFYTSMHDQQLAQSLAGGGSLGLARMLEAQLSKGLPESSAAPSAERPVLPASSVPSAPRHLPVVQNFPKVAALSAAEPVAPASMPGVSAAAAGDPRDFVTRVWPDALAASEVTGLPPNLVIAHAALESGWGRAEPRRADGSPSFNLFGVKAGKGWTGEVVEARTTEFENGRAESRVEKFRAYGSYREAFLDYANLLAGSPRYAGVLASGNGTDFANSLQQSGYATDPMYAAKLSRIIQGKTLRDALQG
jgi:flagellar protein FlgJ